MIGPQRYTNGQQAYDELLNSANDQGNAHQNRHEISPHTCLMATIKKKQKIISVGKDVEKLEQLCTDGGKWCSHYGKLHGDSSKN